MLVKYFRGFQRPDSRSEQVVNELFTLERKPAGLPAWPTPDSR